MDSAAIKALATIKLKPNPYLRAEVLNKQGILVPGTDIPFLYQKRMVLMMVLKPRMVVGDDVGIGKTLEAIIAHTVFKTQRPDTKAIVFAEKAALKQWRDEFEWLTTLKTKIISTELFPNSKQRVSAMRNFSSDVMITTYGQAYNYLPYIREGLGDRFVFYADEPNVFKNIDSQLHKRMYELSCQAHRSYGLTATIVENKLEEAFGILRVVSPGLLSNITDFYNNYCERRKLKNRNMLVTVGYKNLDKFREAIEPGYYGRLQTDPEVEQDLPEDLHKDVPIILSKEQSLKIVEAMDRIIQMPEGDIKQLGILPSLIMAQQLTNDPRVAKFDIEGGKIPVLKELLLGSLKGEKVIIFSKYRSMIDMIEKELTKDVGECVRITGIENQAGTSETSKLRFMDDGPNGCNILLITRAGLKSLNLQKSGHIFAFDMPWSYGHYRQFVGRVKRTGSLFKKVMVYRMMGVLHPEVAELLGSDDTIDQHSLRVVMKKKDLFNAVTGDVTTIETTPGELKELFDEIRKGKKAA